MLSRAVCENDLQYNQPEKYQFFMGTDYVNSHVSKKQQRFQDSNTL